MLTPASTTALTVDTDNGRIHNYPCTVISSYGQQFVFYEKFLATGKQSFSRITFTSPSFVANIEAGNGVLNGTPITWSAAAITCNSNSYSLIYVDSSGNVGIDYTFNISFMSSVIQLAYVSAGATSITRIEELEWTGYCICLRKQELSGGVYVWSNREYRLNSGEQPKAFYCSNSSNIYLTYQKDDIEYVRVFDPTDELTWEYLPNIGIQSDVISLNNQPQNAIIFSISSGHTAEADVVDSDLYPMGYTGFCFIDGSTYIFLPTIGGSFLQYITNQIVKYEILYKINGNYHVEATYYLDFHTKLDRWKLWTGTTGTKYVRVTVDNSIIPPQYITDEYYFVNMNIYVRPAETIVEHSTRYSTDGRDDTLSLAVGSGCETVITKTAEYYELKEFDTDTLALAVGSGYEAVVTKTTEYDELKAFNTDTLSLAVGSGYEAVVTFSSY